MANSLCLVILSLLGLVTIEATYLTYPGITSQGPAYAGITYPYIYCPGIASYYTAPYTHPLTSACYGNTDEGTMIAAASTAIWDNGATCGRMYTITCNKADNPCTGATVTVKVVHYCQNCDGTFALSQEVFQNLSTNLGVGSIKIEYYWTEYASPVKTLKAQMIYCPV
ncbi:hypothetical protein LUZ60_001350 [Juncus effusus]|nr:hypothetical protein LUZ60_001350 [Juncus effusus]